MHPYSHYVRQQSALLQGTEVVAGATNPTPNLPPRNIDMSSSRDNLNFASFGKAPSMLQFAQELGALSPSQRRLRLEMQQRLHANRLVQLQRLRAQNEALLGKNILLQAQVQRVKGRNDKSLGSIGGPPKKDPSGLPVPSSLVGTIDRSSEMSDALFASGGGEVGTMTMMAAVAALSCARQQKSTTHFEGVNDGKAFRDTSFPGPRRRSEPPSFYCGAPPSFCALWDSLKAKLSIGGNRKSGDDDDKTTEVDGALLRQEFGYAIHHARVNIVNDTSVTGKYTGKGASEVESYATKLLRERRTDLLTSSRNAKIVARVGTAALEDRSRRMIEMHQQRRGQGAALGFGPIGEGASSTLNALNMRNVAGSALMAGRIARQETIHRMIGNGMTLSTSPSAEDIAIKRHLLMRHLMQQSHDFSGSGPGSTSPKRKRQELQVNQDLTETPSDKRHCSNSSNDTGQNVHSLFLDYKAKVSNPEVAMRAGTTAGLPTLLPRRNSMQARSA